jgi:tetratricopeptide (TPR) repeat protein
MGRGILVLLISAGMIFSAKAEVLLPDSVEVFLKQNPKDSSYILRLNGIAFAFLKSNPDVGRSLAEKSIEFSKAIHFAKGFTRALNVIGSSYWVTGNYEPALNFYHLSAREAEKINDHTGLAEAYHNMGEVYKKLGDYSKAIAFLQMSMQWDINNKLKYDITLYNIGEAFYLLGDYDSALNYFDRSLSQALKSNDVRAIAYAYTGLGQIKYHAKDYYQALGYFTNAEKLWKEQGEIRSLVQTYQEFSKTYIALQQGSRALDYINLAIILADEISAPDLQIQNYKTASELYVNVGDMKKAMGAMETHVALKDSIYHEKRRLDIARLQAQFESGALDIENQQLKATQALQHAQIRTQKLMLTSLTGALLAAGVLAFVWFRQRKKVAEVNELLRVKTEEIHDLNKSLESKIEERTQRLTWQNEKLAEYAHANAHQLRAPVVSILGLLNLIGRIQLQQEDQILIDKLQLCGKDLDQITRVIAKNLEEDELLK